MYDFLQWFEAEKLSLQNPPINQKKKRVKQYGNWVFSSSLAQKWGDLLGAGWGKETSPWFILPPAW